MKSQQLTSQRVSLFAEQPGCAAIYEALAALTDEAPAAKRGLWGRIVGRVGGKRLRQQPKNFAPGEFRSAEYWEERYKAGGNSGLGSYGKTLTVLYNIELPDEEEEDDERSLEESWTPRFRK